MCYSAMVLQDAKKLKLRYHARIQTELYSELFTRRLTGDKILLNKAMEYQFTHNPEGTTEKAIAKAIAEWHQQQIAKIETELFQQKQRLDKASKALEVKPTKKAQEDARIAPKKIEKLKSDLKKHHSVELKSESDQRIFPFHYVSMLCLDENGEKVIRPVRYHMRPHDADESFDKEYEGCYNARLDNLRRVRWWKDSLGKRHGLILVRKFYENVPTARYLENFKLPENLKERDNIVLCFEPDNVEYMFIPMLWDSWTKKGSAPLYSAALITDDPAPEIAAAGHDRTPIFLKESAIDDWLSIDNGNQERALEILKEREHPHYSHQLAVAS